MLPTPELGESACTQANLADNGFFRNWVAGIVFGFVNLIKSEALLNFYTPQGTGYSEVIIIQTSSHPLSTPGYWWCLCARPQLFPCLLCVLFSTWATRYLFTVTYQGSSILNQWWEIRIPLINQAKGYTPALLWYIPSNKHRNLSGSWSWLLTFAHKHEPCDLSSLASCNQGFSLGARQVAHNWWQSVAKLQEQLTEPHKSL